MDTKKALMVLFILLFSVVAAVAQWRDHIQTPGSASEKFPMAYDSDRGVIVRFGADYQHDHTWEWNGLGWVRVAEVTSWAPPGEDWAYWAPEVMAYDRTRGKVVLFISGYRKGITWEWDGKSWELVDTESGPLGSETLQMAFDHSRGALILVDGGEGYPPVERESSTWQWDGTSWQLLNENVLPVYNHLRMAYDYTRGKIVLLGSRHSEAGDVSETWEFENDSWVLKSNAAVGVGGHEMQFNPMVDKIMLYARRTHHPRKVWEWDGANWEETKIGLPETENAGRAIYDEKNDRLLRVTASEVWATNNNGWERVFHIVLPGFSSSYATYDETRAKYVMYVETWPRKIQEWDGYRWTEHELKTESSRGQGSARTYDPKNRRSIYFGGQIYRGADYSDFSNSTWILKNGRLRTLQLPGPEPRAHAAMVYDSDKDVVVLFGGHNVAKQGEGRDEIPIYKGVVFGDTWQLKGKRWKKIHDSSDMKVVFPKMAYDPASKKILMIGSVWKDYRPGKPIPDGGNSGLEPSTWEFNGKKWRRIGNTLPSIGLLGESELVYDINANAFVGLGKLFNQNPPLHHIATPFWRWLGRKAQWKMISEDAIVPFNATSSSVVYDAQNGQVISHSHSRLWQFGSYRPTITASTDFDGDGAADPAIYDQGSNTWIVHGMPDRRFGMEADIPASADYDGDGKAELAVFRPKSGRWVVKGGQRIKGFGEIGDVPVPGDYDGDGKDDIALFRPKDGRWFTPESKLGRFHSAPSIPVPADYNGDGKTDLAVYLVENGAWAIKNMSYKWLPAYNADAIPAPADYDGDGKAEIAVYVPSKGIWIIEGREPLEFGLLDDIPVPADYDGDGIADIAVYRPNTGEWLIYNGSRFALGPANSVPLH